MLFRDAYVGVKTLKKDMEVINVKSQNGDYFWGEGAPGRCLTHPQRDSGDLRYLLYNDSLCYTFVLFTLLYMCYIDPKKKKIVKDR